MKKQPIFFTLALLLTLTACRAAQIPAEPAEPAGQIELHVFAAASLTETLDKIIAQYKDAAPDITITPTYDSSGTLLTQIQEGADCDLFLSAAPKQMDALDRVSALLDGARLDLLENRVVLTVPAGNPKNITSFGHLAELLKTGGVLLAMGNGDVPVGQYTQKIFAYYNLDENELASSGVLTYGSNVKEVTTHVAESMADCGIIYATDAYSAGLEIVDSATAEMCGQVIYPAAVLGNSQRLEEAKAFLTHLTTPEAAAIFETVGFTHLP